MHHLLAAMDFPEVKKCSFIDATVFYRVRLVMDKLNYELLLTK